MYDQTPPYWNAVYIFVKITWDADESPWNSVQEESQLPWGELQTPLHISPLRAMGGSSPELSSIK